MDRAPDVLGARAGCVRAHAGPRRSGRDAVGRPGSALARQGLVRVVVIARLGLPVAPGRVRGSQPPVEPAQRRRNHRHVRGRFHQPVYWPCRIDRVVLGGLPDQPDPVGEFYAQLLGGRGRRRHAQRLGSVLGIFQGWFGQRVPARRTQDPRRDHPPGTSTGPRQESRPETSQDRSD